MKERADWMQPLAEGCPTTGAEVVYAIRNEMAMRLSDIVIRRTGLGAAGHPGREAVAACASLAASHLGWNEQRVTAEISAVDAFYAIEN